MKRTRFHPEGWHPLPVQTWTNGDELALIGDPPDEDQDPNSEIHHCDSMGCGIEHVLLRIELPESVRPCVRHLIPPDGSIDDMGGNLRRFREQMGWTQSQLAERSGMVAAAISHFEANRRNPSIQNLCRLADALGITTDALLGRKART